MKQHASSARIQAGKFGRLAAANIRSLNRRAQPSVTKLDGEAKALLFKLINGQTKLRLFPSGQWSIAGVQFISTKQPERLLQLGLIEKSVVSRRGVWIHVPTAVARLLYNPESTSVPRQDCPAAVTGQGATVEENEARLGTVSDVR